MNAGALTSLGLMIPLIAHIASLVHSMKNLYVTTALICNPPFLDFTIDYKTNSIKYEIKIT